jgi:hypothetical protein
MNRMNGMNRMNIKTIINFLFGQGLFFCSVKDFFLFGQGLFLSIVHKFDFLID